MDYFISLHHAGGGGVQWLGLLLTLSTHSLRSFSLWGGVLGYSILWYDLFLEKFTKSIFNILFDRLMGFRWDVLFSDLVTACSIGSCSNHSHFGGVLWSYRRSALLSWYKYLLFRNAFATAEWCFSWSLCRLARLASSQRSSSHMSSLSTLVLIQVSSLQECLHNNG